MEFLKFDGIRDVPYGLEHFKPGFFVLQDTVHVFQTTDHRFKARLNSDSGEYFSCAQ